MNKILFTIDDYDEENIKFAEKLEKAGLKDSTIFFIELQPFGSQTQIRRLAQMGFTIGCHTISHPQDMKLLSKEMLTYEISVCKDMLKDWTKQPIDWFCYPRGRYNNKTIDCLKKNKFKCARTTVIGCNWEDNYRLPCIHLGYPRDEYNGKDWLDIAKQWYDKARVEDKTLITFMHSWEIRKFNQYEKLDLFIDYIK